jgi:hypothetical protein
MAAESSLAAPSIPFLRRLAEQQNVHPEDADLELVLGFLRLILPALADLERRLPQDLPPAAGP